MEMIVIMEPRTSAHPVWNIRHEMLPPSGHKTLEYVLVAGFNARAAIKDQDFTHWQAPATDAIKEAK